MQDLSMEGSSMTSKKATVRTFYGDESEIVAELLGPPSSTGLCKLSYKDTTFVRHVSRLVPKSKEAHDILADIK